MTDNANPLLGIADLIDYAAVKPEHIAPAVRTLSDELRGIIARVTKILYEYDVNILDISQTIVSGLFSMIMVVDISSEHCNFDGVSQELASLGERLGLQIRIQRHEIFDAMHHI